MVGSVFSCIPFYRDLRPEGANNGLFGAGYLLQMYAPLILWCIASQLQPRTLDLLDRWCQPMPLLVAGTVAVALVPVLDLLHLAGAWWTWGTIGLYAGACLLVYESTRGQVGNFRAVVAALGVFGVAAALWETLYQSSYAWFYPQDFQVPAAAANVLTNLAPHERVWAIWSIGQAEKMLPLLIGGGLCCWWAYRPRWRTGTTLAFMVCLCLFTAWCAAGLPLEVRWSTPQGGSLVAQLAHTATAWPGRMLQRLMKEAVTVMVVSLYWRAR